MIRGLLSGYPGSRASGLTVDTWCKQNGLTSKNYYYWMRKIKREAFDLLPDDIKTRPCPPTVAENSMGVPFHEYPEYLEDHLPWNEYIQKICR